MCKWIHGLIVVIHITVEVAAVVEAVDEECRSVAGGITMSRRDRILVLLCYELARSMIGASTLHRLLRIRDLGGFAPDFRALLAKQDSATFTVVRHGKFSPSLLVIPHPGLQCF